MPFDKKTELPEAVKDNLPEHAQTIWMESFNSALEQYSDQDDTDETAARVAWSAVKNVYEKRDGKWQKKE
ncbi:cation transporter [Candidatus Dojkabacteria bacterium]|nr:cation transporter [Candidatus Dojkabacteria bacterium]